MTNTAINPNTRIIYHPLINKNSSLPKSLINIFSFWLSPSISALWWEELGPSPYPLYQETICLWNIKGDTCQLEPDQGGWTVGFPRKARGSSWSPQGALRDLRDVRGLRPALTEGRKRMGWDVRSLRARSVSGRSRPRGSGAATTLCIGSQISWVLRSSLGPTRESWDKKYLR